MHSADMIILSVPTVNTYAYSWHMVDSIILSVPAVHTGA